MNVCDLFNFRQSAIRRVNISGNVDNPEGTMDALMQIAVCGSVRMLPKPFLDLFSQSRIIVGNIFTFFYDFIVNNYPPLSPTLR